MKTLVRVTLEHIDEGQMKDCFACPVALAINDAGLDLEDVRVTPCSFFFGPKGKPVRVKLPRPASDFIAHFDIGKPVSPFEFEIDIPDELLNGAAQ